MGSTAVRALLQERGTLRQEWQGPSSFASRSESPATDIGRAVQVPKTESQEDTCVSCGARRLAWRRLRAPSRWCGSSDVSLLCNCQLDPAVYKLQGSSIGWTPARKTCTWVFCLWVVRLCRFLELIEPCVFTATFLALFQTAALFGKF